MGGWVGPRAGLDAEDTAEGVKVCKSLVEKKVKERVHLVDLVQMGK
jgi:hypothetical protein